MAKQRTVSALWIDPRLCKGTEGCRICIDICPESVLGASPALSPKGVHPAAAVDLGKCTGCDLCALYCPDLAIVVEYEHAA